MFSKFFLCMTRVLVHCGVCDSLMVGILAFFVLLFPFLVGLLAHPTFFLDILHGLLALLLAFFTTLARLVAC
jgi:hypothetical protein